MARLEDRPALAPVRRRRIGRGVAQPGRALSSGGRGRRFESSLPDQVFRHFCPERDRGWRFLLNLMRRSEEHTSELQSLMRISYAVFCLKKKKTSTPTNLDRTPQQPQTQYSSNN